ASISPALELGRSFVRPEYQKSYQPLLLLWKGLAHYVAAHPRYRILFGPVSISNDYTPASQALIVSYLRGQHGSDPLANYVRPRNRFGWQALPASNYLPLAKNISDLSALVSDLEGDGKGIPVLLHHYLNLGGRVLAFSVDKSFSNVLDGLIVVDL